MAHWGMRRALVLLTRQVANPIVLVLIACSGGSAFVGDAASAWIILVILVASVALGFQQEWKADRALAALLARVRAYSTVVRDGVERRVPTDEVQVGDVAVLSAGAAIPGDGVLIAAHDLAVSEAALTGES